MIPRIAHPMIRRDPDALIAAARAAGFAAVCEWETSEQWQRYTLATNQQKRREAGYAFLPSPMAMLLAMVLVTL